MNTRHRKVYFLGSACGFALPTILIASVVMLIVLVVAVSMTSSLRSALDNQYYNSLSREAAESGLAYAGACLDIDAKATWATLKPQTDCSGVEQVACPVASLDARCGVINTLQIKTSFTISKPVTTGVTTQVTATGTVSLLRSSDRQVWRTWEHSATRAVTQINNPASLRATQRYWYFGDVAVFDFGVSGDSSPIVSSAPMGTGSSEGTTVITDKSGNLVFRSNGRTVWDKSDAVMQDSDGLNATNSTTQAVVAFPLDRQGVKYAIVTNTAINESGGKGELYYSIIDMSLNGGLGGVDVSKKNIKLGTGIKYSTEALTAVPNAYGDGYWVYTFTPGTRNVVGFQFKLDGTVSASPVVSLTSQPIAQCDADRSGYGTLYFDTQFNRLLMSSSPAGCGAPGYDIGALRLFDFDATNGQLSEKFSWEMGSSQMKPGDSNAGYSADFSPAEKYVYATQIYPPRVYRYSIENKSSSAAVKASEEYVGASASGYAGGGHIRRAPNNKMYVANNTFNNVSVIERPDDPIGSIGWAPSGLTLSPGVISRFGLPQMVALYDPRTIFN